MGEPLSPHFEHMSLVVQFGNSVIMDDSTGSVMVHFGYA